MSSNLHGWNWSRSPAPFNLKPHRRPIMNRRSFMVALTGGAAGVLGAGEVAKSVDPVFAQEISVTDYELGCDGLSFYKWHSLDSGIPPAPCPVKAIRYRAGRNDRLVARLVGATGTGKYRGWTKPIFGLTRAWRASHDGQWLILYGPDVYDRTFMDDRAFRSLFKPSRAQYQHHRRLANKSLTNHTQETHHGI